MRRALSIVVLAAGCCGLSVDLCGAPSPQPRVRLHREASSATARMEEKSAAADDAVVVAAKYVVRDSTLPAPPRPLGEEKRISFSPRAGGPLLVKTSEKFDLSIGVWRHVELFGEEARFKPQGTRAEFDLLRAKR